MRIKHIARLFLSVTMVMASISVMAQKTICVLSDLHVMAPELLIQDGTAFQKYLANDRKMVDYSQTIFDQLVSSIETAKPDLVLITGDMTKDGEVLSHQYVKKGLDRWKEAGIPTLLIPGNHDFGTAFSKYYYGSVTYDAEVLSLDGYKTLYKGYGYFDHTDESQAFFSDLSYWQQPLEGLIVIGLDSHEGTISQGDLDEACRRIKWARHDGYEVIVMMHHSLIPHFYLENKYMDDALVADFETVKTALLDAGANIVLSGHFHTSDIARDFNSDLTESILDISNGSPISYPCDYRILTFNPSTKQVHVETKSITQVEGVEGFQELAKSRAFNSWKKTASTMITKMVNEMAPSYSNYLPIFLNKWSEALANAFILHAEGNEENANASQKAAIREDLSLPLQLIPEADYVLTSVLEDITPYDPEGTDPRTNVTDDRTLTIDHGYVTIEMGAPSKSEIIRRSPEIPSAATVFYSDVNLFVPEGVEVFTLKLDEEGALKTTKKSQVYTEGEVIPAGTAVIVQSVINPFDYVGNTTLDFRQLLEKSYELGIPDYTKCSFRTTEEKGTADPENALTGFDEASMTVGPSTAVDYKFYKLCWNQAVEDNVAGEYIGFYYAASNGAAFLSSAHKAYLAVPADSAADSYSFDDLTGIREMRMGHAASPAIYTLTGMKVEGKPMRKGIYIMQGKKTVVR